MKKNFRIQGKPKAKGPRIPSFRTQGRMKNYNTCQAKIKYQYPGKGKLK